MSSLSIVLNDDKMVGVKAAAQIIGVCEKTVRNWAKDGTLPGVRVGPKLIKFAPETLRAFLNGGNA